jgi:hypothetical protein
MHTHPSTNLVSASALPPHRTSSSSSPPLHPRQGRTLRPPTPKGRGHPRDSSKSLPTPTTKHPLSWSLPATHSRSRIPTRTRTLLAKSSPVCTLPLLRNAVPLSRGLRHHRHLIHLRRHSTNLIANPHIWIFRLRLIPLRKSTRGAEKDSMRMSPLTRHSPQKAQQMSKDHFPMHQLSQCHLLSHSRLYPWRSNTCRLHSLEENRVQTAIPSHCLCHPSSSSKMRQLKPSRGKKVLLRLLPTASSVLTPLLRLVA